MPANSVSETSLCNMALGRIGAERLNDLAEDASVEAIHCNLHYKQTRDALLESHRWRFALGRSTLSEDTETPDFEWGHQFVLPTDCLRVLSLFDTENSYAVADDLLLTNDDEAELKYIKKIVDPAKFSSLYIEVLVLQLAIKLVMPLSRGQKMRREIQDELGLMMANAKMVNRTELESIGRADSNLWLEARRVTTP